MFLSRLTILLPAVALVCAMVPPGLRLHDLGNGVGGGPPGVSPRMSEAISDDLMSVNKRVAPADQFGLGSELGNGPQRLSPRIPGMVSDDSVSVDKRVAPGVRSDLFEGNELGEGYPGLSPRMPDMISGINDLTSRSFSKRLPPGFQLDLAGNELGEGADGHASRFTNTTADVRMSDPASFGPGQEAFPKEFLDRILIGSPNDTADVIPGPPLTPDELNYEITLQDQAEFNQVNDVSVDPIELAGAFEGDIRISTLDEVFQMPARSRSDGKQDEEPSRNAIKAHRKWPNNRIPYVIDALYSEADRLVIANAMQVFKTQTCLEFIPRHDQRDYVLIYKGSNPLTSGCSSYVGRVPNGGKQTLTLGKGCLYPGIVMHELMHAVGFWHEQSRLDRDNYITVIFRNIANNMEHNFLKNDRGEVSDLGLRYDYGSIMHYGRSAFAKSRGLETIRPKDPNQNIGQRSRFSELDLAKLNKLYNCNGAVVQPEVITPTVSTKCKDQHESCAAWSGRGECKENPTYMTINCRDSCGKCPTDDRQDLHEHCVYWANKGECNANPNYMNKHCMLSCDVPVGACSDDNDKCAFWAQTGECRKNPDYMKISCKKSCNNCGAQRGPKSESTCKDNDEKCEYWGKNGFCLTHDDIKNEKCPKTCKVC